MGMVKDIFNSITDEELLIAVQDIKTTAETTGRVSLSAKEYGNKIRNLGYPSKYDFENARNLLLEQAAFRWAKSQIAVQKLKEEDERKII